MSTSEKLLNLYKSSTVTERLIVDYLSLTKEFQNRTDILKLLEAAGVQSDGGKKLTTTYLKPYIDNLIAKELLVETAVNANRKEVACNPLIANYIFHEKLSDIEKFSEMAEQIRHLLPAFRESGYVIHSQSQSLRFALRDIRLAFYTNNFNLFNELLQKCFRNGMDPIRESNVISEVFDSPFRANWFATRKLEIQRFAMNHLFYSTLLNLGNLSIYVDFMRQAIAHPSKNTPVINYRLMLFITEMLYGNPDVAETLIEPLKSEYPIHHACTGMILFAKGKYADSVQAYQNFFNETLAGSRKRTAAINHFSGIFYPLALLKAKPQNHADTIRNQVRTEIKIDVHYLQAYRALDIVGDVLHAKMSSGQENLWFMLKEPSDTLNGLFSALVSNWYFPEFLKHGRDMLEGGYRRAKRFGYRWLEVEFAGMLSRLEPDSPNYQESLDLAEQIGIKPMHKLVGNQEPWERVLEMLAGYGGQTVTAKTVDTRLVWLLAFPKNMDTAIIQPKEQKLNKSGSWSTGRNVALRRLMESDVDGMTDQDRRVAQHIFREERYYGSVQYYFDVPKALSELVGHPLLFLEESPKTPVELVKSEPTLVLEKKDRGYALKFAEKFEHAGVKIIQDEPTRFRLLIVQQSHVDIMNILNSKQLQVPEAAKEQLMEAVGNVSRLVTVHSAVEGELGSIESVSSDATIHLHLLPVGDGFRLDMLVRPFGKSGPYFQPGKSPEQIIAEVDGKRQQTRRDLKLEKDKAHDVLKKCPFLLVTHDGSYDWRFQTPEDCLEALSEMENVRDETIIEWPEGEKLKIYRQISPQQLYLRVQRENDWFELQGELKVDDHTVIQIKQLLDLLQHSSGRFVELSEGHFIALSKQFRRQLEDLRTFSDSTKNGARFHPLMAPIIDAFAGEIGKFSGDAEWNAAVERIKNAENHSPKPPSTLQAVLRDYQLEGFQWLSRLAKWGVGACLADDMGLGKTVQALAAIIERANDGPTLVIAPASVTSNWISEAQRFSPTLNPVFLGATDREETIRNIGPFDLLVCSYGLLPYEIERLAQVKWQTIVLDEAQSIKNAATKRSQAAMQLNGEFKMITTGTPVENHLGELWNLFRFINPGLLGSLKKFNEKYAAQIEKFQDSEAKGRLKRLLQPFILRRLKNDVLSELPPKTEITLTVNLSDEEQAFYEALRQRAVENIMANDNPVEDRRFQILAEIMKLRRACCHPRLVVPETTLGSAKLALFAETLDELLDNNHKALVFSQFVDHLTVIREYLDSKQIAYQYLDGSTPTRKRQEIVRNFQSGNGDVFLISLRAGGMGLNLTAADYVIHLDPWWNPAVEDQASDRSHRIGQQRPVTVYRLVAKNTIEEKIIALHHTKKDLADSLLEGTDVSGKISAEDLLNILKDQ